MKLFFALAAVSQSTAYSPSGAWEMAELGYCFSGISYEGEADVGLIYDGKEDVASLTVTEPSWTWVVNGANYKVMIDLGVEGNYEPMAAVGANLTEEAVKVNAVTMFLEGEKFLSDFARAEFMRLFVDGKLVGEFSLQGVGVVASRLVDCYNEKEAAAEPDQ